MPVKIRLQRKGRKKSPFYHIVAADSRAPRDGKFIEKLGTYNPMTKPATIELDRDRAYTWLMNGAQPTDTARSILRLKGVLYKKHLMEGVRKGAISQEVADEKYQVWIEAKEAKLAARVAKSAEERRAYNARIAGLDDSVKLVEEVSEEGAETATAILQEETATEEAPAKEETPAE
ncbi:MAG: 30S ribosomal protein S16 [Bacteroidota bacterium]